MSSTDTERRFGGTESGPMAVTTDRVSVHRHGAFVAGGAVAVLAVGLSVWLLLGPEPELPSIGGAGSGVASEVGSGAGISRAETPDVSAAVDAVGPADSEAGESRALEVGSAAESSGSRLAADSATAEDIEQVATAKRRFYEYLDLRDDLYSDPGAPMDQVYQYAVGREIDVMGGTLAAFRKNGTTFVGETTVSSFSVDSSGLDDRSPRLEFQACLVRPDEHKNGQSYRNPDGYYGPSLMDVVMIRNGREWFVEWTDLGDGSLRPC